jgi:hypothetical protein
VSSNPPTPASQCGLSYAISGDVGTGDIPAAVVWYIMIGNGLPSIRCFVPGPEG